MRSLAKTIPDRQWVNFSWLVKLRWASLVGQIATMAGVSWWFAVTLPWYSLCLVLAIEAGSNLLCAIALRRGVRIKHSHLAAVMALDVLLLSALLFFTGGPANPFCFLYLVNIALAAVALPATWSWLLVLLSLASFGILANLRHWPFPADVHSAAERQRLHELGELAALGVAAAFIVHFVWRVTRSLALREKELAELSSQARQKEQLASLATLAAGAAHELATPLGTIAVIAKELEYELRKPETQPEAVLEDVKLVRQQVARCRAILDQMAVGFGKSADEAVEAINLGELVQECTNGIRAVPRVVVNLDGCPASTPLQLPKQAVVSAIRGLLTNAQDASAEGFPVELKAAVAHRALHFSIKDQGQGMAPEVVARLGEPFFTTKAPGKGMGLGFFLTRVVVDRLGGNLSLDSVPERGTEVRVTIPADVNATKQLRN